MNSKAPTKNTANGVWMVASVIVLAGCAGAPKQVGSEDDFKPKPASTDTEAAPPPAAEAPAEPAPPSGDPVARFNSAQKEQLKVSLGRAANNAAKCADVVPNSPSGDGEVKVSYDGKSGHATQVTVSPPYGGTPVEACIKQAFKQEMILPFEAPSAEVPYKIKLAAKAAPPPDPKKKK